MANNNASTPVRTAVARSQPEAPVAPPSQAAVYMRPPPPPPPAPSCVLLVSGAENQQSSVMYYISSGSTITSAPRARVSVSASSAVAVAATAATAAVGVTSSSVSQEEPLTLHLPEGVSAVVVTGGDSSVHVGDEDLNAARVAAADAHVVASATAALTTTTNNPTLIADSGPLVTATAALGRSQVNCTPHRLPQQQQVPPQPPSSGMVSSSKGFLIISLTLHFI